VYYVNFVFKNKKFMKVCILPVLFFFIQNLIAQSNTEHWQADISILQRELPKRHPDFYRFYPQPEFDADIQALQSSLSGKTDLQIGLELQTIVAKVRDAQTRLELAPLLQQNAVIPIGLGWYADGLYTSATVKKFAPALGKRILEINGQETALVLEKMGRFFAKENEEALRKEGPQWLRFPEAFRMAGVSETDTLALLMVDEKGQRYFLKAHPVDFQKDKTGLQPAQFVPKTPDLRWNPMKQVFSIVWLESDSIAYVQYNACLSQEMMLAVGDSLSAGQFPPFQPVADSVMRLLDQHPGARFFFDLRFNTGGVPADGIALSERLGVLPFVNLPNRIYVATNRYTAGAAVEIAAAFQKNTNATLLGEAPAQRPNHFGDVQSFYLPNTRIQVFHGTRQVELSPGNPDKIRLNVPIELPFNDFRDGRDPVLDFVRRKGSRQ